MLTSIPITILIKVLFQSHKNRLIKTFVLTRMGYRKLSKSFFIKETKLSLIYKNIYILIKLKNLNWG